MRRKDLNCDLARLLFAPLRQIGPYYLADFYPLAPYTLANDAWMAWQYHNADAGEGVVQAFRRPNNREAGKLLRLEGLDGTAMYEVADLDVEKPQTLSGKELMEKGLAVPIKQAPGAVVIVYRRAR